MSNIAQAFALVTIGGLVGFGGFALMTEQATPAEATPAAVVIAPQAPAPAPEPEQAEIRPEAVSVAYATTGSLESDFADGAFAVLRVTAEADVADVVLEVGGRAGTTPEDAFGADGVTRTGSSLRIELGEMHARQDREVVIAFRLRGERGSFTTATSYLDLHTGEQTSVAGSREGNSLTRSIREAATYETVRRVYSDHALEVARELRDSGDYAEALEWVEDTHAANVAVGMTLRITQDLAAAQADLSNLRDELKVLMKPKKKVIRKAKPAPSIEFFGGDT